MADLSLPANLVKVRMRDALKTCPCCGAALKGIHEWAPEDRDDAFAQVSFACGAVVQVPHDGDQFRIVSACPDPLSDALDDIWDTVLAAVEGEIPEPPEAA